jgi:hypothetical protein
MAGEEREMAAAKAYQLAGESISINGNVKLMKA